MSGDTACEFGRVGAFRFPSVLNPEERARIATLFGQGDRPGKRLARNEVKCIADLISADGAIGRIAADLLGIGAKPVRALLLDKSEAANWRLGWHQDRTIAVTQRIDVPDFGPWTVKAGQPHVQPPHEISARMVTLRVHVDDVDRDNAPLEVLPGSHRLGCLDNGAVKKLAAEQEPVICVADAGDVWAYSTGIVHASAEQKLAGRRRVLQIDYSADELPGGLEWAALV